MNTCNAQRPATLLLGGAAASEGRESLIFTPAHPCGVETNATTGEVAPLTSIMVYDGCVGEECPGDLVLISSRVQTIRQERSGVIGPFQMVDCGANVARKQPRVKLRVTHCASNTSLVIDSDSSIAIPAGKVWIEALVPGASALDVSFANGRWQEYGSLNVPVQLWEDTRLEVRACPLRGCCPCGTLSERMRFVFEGVLDGILLTPRGARELAVSVTSLGVPADIRVEYLSRLDAASDFGADTLAANDRDVVPLFGDAPAIALVLPADEDFDAYVRWKVCGL
jgi:hypothetical protein